ncbi:beta-mannosidase [Catenulispora rubra]|uniref:beta-mannosidase n=1 Tax=Catenulispora rubra TaxID=280293 RepID=UPI001892662F|nr:glycoside hydrolase family 2 protein [Catenulispora rubra]
MPQQRPTATRQPVVLDRFELAATPDDVADPAALAAADPRWMPAVVPGGVHESLLAAGEIEHPYLDGNEEAVGWVEQGVWWYRTSFELADPVPAGDRLRLVCHGLDTVATLWLNGAGLGTHETMFRPAEFDVTDLVTAHNTLIIRFRPPLDGLSVPPAIAETAARVRVALNSLTEVGTESDENENPPGILSGNLALTLRRKATFSWGWDFAPRLPSMGLWQPVELVQDHGAVITGHHIRVTSLDKQTREVQVAVSVGVEALAGTGDLDASIVLTAPGGARTELRLELPATQGADRGAEGWVVIQEAQLWWTHDLGSQPLYDVVIEIGDANGPLDRATDRIGLRTITLDRSQDAVEGGRHFRFVLNDTPLFARGANWVPASMLVGSVTAEDHRSLVRTARHGNMTMLRVWGGGVYEPDAFYEACDEQGILVWQDFMFACIDYPSDDPHLYAEVVKEAEFQVSRLRNHASLALWCGNNEVHALHGVVYGNLDPGGWGWSFFHEVLPDAVQRFSPGTVYWPGSPWADSDPRGVNGVADGDRHAWEVWHGVDVGAGGPTEFAGKGESVHFGRYTHDRGKFISEFGIHAAPELPTLERWTPGEELSLKSEAFLRRIKDKPKNKGDELMAFETGLPHDLGEYIDFSMACQAEGLKFGIEHYRRRQPHNSGTLVWQLNDAWPGLSWSIIDFDHVPKAGFYFTQRAYTPLLASFLHQPDGSLELWLTNSGIQAAAGEVRIEVATFDGKHVIDELIAVTIDALDSGPVWRADAEQVAAGPDRFAWVSSPDGLIADNRLFFARLKDLAFGEPSLQATVTRVDATSASVRIQAQGYNYLTRVTSLIAGACFSANYFDLRDGEHAEIAVTGLPSGFDLAALSIAAYGPRPATTTRIET